MTSSVDFCEGCGETTGLRTIRVWVDFSGDARQVEAVLCADCRALLADDPDRWAPSRKAVAQ